jgi:propionate CoA-transferase
VLDERLSKVGKRMVAIVNYDDFTVDPTVSDTYAALVRYIETNYYAAVSRYSTSAFMRAKLGEALARRSVAPHIFESADEAHASVNLSPAAPGKP